MTNAKPALAKILQRGQESARISGTYTAKRHGHLLFKDIDSPGGEIGHIWVNHRALGQMPQLLCGQRVSFIATLRSYQKKSGEHSVRCEDLREVRVL